jgi:hypothetical protein
MSISSGPKVINNSLLLDLDANNFKQAGSTTITNIINPFTVNYSAYNNPGFTTTVTRTNQLFKGAPVHRITFSPQDAARIPRLGSTEGFGHFHGMQTSLLPNTPYMASVYFRTNYPLNTSTFSNTYSNIGGWGNSSTGTTRFTEGAWTRFYTRFLNNITIGGVNYCTRDSYGAGVINVNTSEQTDITLTITFNANRTVTITGPLNSVVIGISESSTMVGIRSLSPNIDSTTVTGLSTGGSAIINHGLNTSTWTKITNESPIYHANFPITYYATVRVPSTSGIQRTINFRPTIFAFNSSISDQKFWKITFDTSRLAVGDVIETFWAAPMIEQTDRLYPSPYTIGSNNRKFFTSTNWPDLKTGLNSTLINGPIYSSNGNGSFSFDGSNDHVNTNYDLSWNNTNSVSISMFVRPRTTSQAAGIIGKPSPDYEWAIMHGTSGGGSSNKLTFVYWNISGNHSNGPVIEINNFFDTTNWVNIVLTWSHITNKIKIYKNGILVNESNWINASINMNRTNSVFLGGAIYTWNTGYWQGDISKVSMYGKELTESEIKQNFEALRRRYFI